MIAALVPATKPRSGLSNQMKICVGSAVDGVEHDCRVPGTRDEGIHADQEQGSRLAQRLGEADDGPGENARHGERQHVVGHRLQS
jgi:hypothetical protein